MLLHVELFLFANSCSGWAEEILLAQRDTANDRVARCFSASRTTRPILASLHRLYDGHLPVELIS